MSRNRVPSPRRVDETRGRVGHALAAGRVQHGAQEAPRVGLELGLGRPDLLEVEHVEELALEEVSKISWAGPAPCEYGTLML